MLQYLGHFEVDLITNSAHPCLILFAVDLSRGGHSIIFSLIENQWFDSLITSIDIEKSGSFPNSR
jgi:hypothetical protein